MGKRGILVVSFGTSFKETRDKTIGAIERSIQKAFPKDLVYRAFTSKIIKKKLEKEGMIIYNVSEALEKMLQDQITEVLVQPTHIINGIEYDMMYEDIKPYLSKFKKIQLGLPLLSDSQDYSELADAIKNAYPLEKGEGLVLMGHGSNHHANAAYPAFEYVLKDRGYENIFVGTVEGYPSLNEVKKQLAKNKIHKVCLAPMMIVAGDHANNDMIGEEDSWKTELEQEGYRVRYYLKGLGELEEVQRMFIRHAEEATLD